MSGAEAGQPDVTLRPLATLDERRACVALQERVWGEGFSERVPASVLMIAEETGGVAGGAFAGDELVGFVFGITGFRGGERVHWSDMLAVAPEYRGRGLGVRLKRYQRRELLDRGVQRVLWTFDPLEARNAHLNLNRLGAIAREYRRDLYGRSDSPLHAGIGTDRLVAEWLIASDRVARLLDGGGAEGAWEAETDPVFREAVGIEIPADIQALKRDDPDEAAKWRERTRRAFETAFGDGRAAVGLERGGDRPVYVLVAEDQARAFGFSE